LTGRLAIRAAQRAAREIDEAVEWSRKNRSDPPDAIRGQLERAFALISLHPNVGARAVNTVLRDVERD